jgi:type I restriction enzyme S subunit
MSKRWVHTKLGDHLSVLTDYHANGSYEILKKNVELLDASEYAVMIRTTNFENDDFQKNLKFISKNAYDFLSKSKVYPGDILMNKIANAGSVYLMPDLHRPVSLAMNLFLLRTNPKTAIQKYVYFFLKHNEPYIKQFATGTAAVTITKQAVRNLSILLPPLDIQNKISNVISAYDDLIENNKRRIAILEKMAEEIYREWFVRMRFSSYASDSAKASSDKKATEDKPAAGGKTLLDRGWKRLLLPEVAYITYGFPFKSEKFNSDGLGMPIVRIRNIQSASTNEYTNELVDDRYIIRHGDFLIGMDGEFHMNHWIGPDAYLVQRSCRIKAKDSRLDAYLALALHAPIKHYEATIVGATVGHLGAMHLNKIEILSPPEEDISQLKIFSDLLDQQLLLGKINRNLSVTRDLLLPRLISGKLPVENLELPSNEKLASVSSTLPEQELAHA